MACPLLEHNSRHKIMYTCEFLTIYCNSELPQEQTLLVPGALSSSRVCCDDTISTLSTRTD